MSDQVKQIAMRISDLREISDYTVERMAAALDVPVEEYKKIESGEIDIPISFLVKVGETFHMDMTELLTGEAPRLNVFSVTRAGKGGGYYPPQPVCVQKPGFQFCAPQDRAPVCDRACGGKRRNDPQQSRRAGV